MGQCVICNALVSLDEFLLHQDHEPYGHNVTITTIAERLRNQRSQAGKKGWRTRQTNILKRQAQITGPHVGQEEQCEAITSKGKRCTIYAYRWRGHNHVYCHMHHYSRCAFVRGQQGLEPDDITKR